MTTTTYALISSLVNPIREAALMYAMENFFMPQTVTVFGNQTGMQNRIFTQYSGGTVGTSLSETAELAKQTFARSALSTLTPQETGAGWLLSDRRMDSDDVQSITADLAEHIGYTIFKQVESDLAGLFPSFTGGTVGSGGTAMTWSFIYQGRAKLAAAAIPPPYNVVLHEYQWLDLATAANIAGISAAGPLQIRDEIQSRYYLGSTSDMDFYVTGDEVISNGATVYGGIYNRQAIGLDVRRALRIETERDASLRATEFNATIVYAKGLVRPSYGVAIASDATAP